MTTPNSVPDQPGFGQVVPPGGSAYGPAHPVPAQPYPGQPYPGQAVPPQGYGYAPPPGYPIAVAVRPSNGLGTGSFVLSMIAFLFAFLPLIGIFFVIPLGILGVVFGCVGISRAAKGAATNMGIAIAGLIIGLIALSMLFFGGGTLW